MQRAARIEELEDSRRQREMTGNDLYVWEAIKTCHNPVCPLPYPEWVRDYLGTVAVDMIVLGHLLDPGTFPECGPGEAPEAHMERFRAWQSRRIPAAKAAALTATALRLVRKGWNAFRRFHADAAMRSDALHYEFAPEGSHAEVLEALSKRQNLGESRSVKRRIDRGRDLLERSAPPRQVPKPPP